MGEYGNYNQNRVDGYVNIPVTNNFDMRLSAVHQAHDGYVHSATTPGVSMDDDDENAERIAIKWDPTDRLDVVGACRGVGPHGCRFRLLRL